MGYQQELYHNSLEAVRTSPKEGFYFNDFEFRSEFYRVFSYHTMGTIDASNDSHLECRGHTFKIHYDSDIVHMDKLVCLPPRKFFNYGEPSVSSSLVLDDVDRVMVKYDGSLISTIELRTGLYLKSKTSVSSDVANAANDYLAVRPELQAELTTLMKAGLTCNMEWVSPDNQIVLQYDESRLVPFNVRDMNDGATHLELPFSEKEMPILHSMWCETVNIGDTNVETFILNTRQDTGIEGFVLAECAWSSQPYLIKIKTEEYVGLHRIKELLSNQHAVFDLVLDGKHDDVIGTFSLNEIDAGLINDMVVYVESLRTGICQSVEEFYKKYKHLSRKEYAVKATELYKGTIEFSVIMNAFRAGEIEHNTITNLLKRKWREYLPQPR